MRRVAGEGESVRGAQRRPGAGPRASSTKRLGDREVRDFNLVIGGHAFFEALATACELDLFTKLSRRPNRTLGDVASALAIPEPAARVLLLALAAVGLIERHPRRATYRNSRTAEELLTEGSARDMRPAVFAYHRLIYRPLFHLTEAVRKGTNVGLRVFPGSGKTLYRRLARRPRDEQTFQAWLHMVSAQSNRALRSVGRLSRVRHLLDVGGGDGTNAMALRDAFPQMNVTVFDLPTVCRIVRRNVRRAKLEDVIFTRPGDFLTDRFPKGVDGVLFGHILNIFAEATNVKLLRRAYDALPAGGVAICFNSMTDDNETGPLRSAFLSLYFLVLASGEGMVYPWKDYVRWYKQVGFRKVEVHRVGDLMDHGIIVGIK